MSYRVAFIQVRQLGAQAKPTVQNFIIPTYTSGKTLRINVAITSYEYCQMFKVY